MGEFVCVCIRLGGGDYLQGVYHHRGTEQQKFTEVSKNKYARKVWEKELSYLENQCKKRVNCKRIPLCGTDFFGTPSVFYL